MVQRSPRKSSPPVTVDSIEDIELDLLLDAIYRAFGADFRQYARGSVKRRLATLLVQEQLQSFSELQSRVLRTPGLLDRIAAALSVQVSSFFRDPTFYLAFRRSVVPILRTYPSIRIWHAGCATGEEVYSLAILMHEEGLLQKTQFYGTDVSATALEIAARGTYAAAHVDDSAELHCQGGGHGPLRAYFQPAGAELQITEALRRHTVFFRHNLVTDTSFNEFNVILCRNVLIYFQKPLQNRVHELLYNSLVHLGILVLGANERLRFTSMETRYRALDDANRIFRRVD